MKFSINSAKIEGFKGFTDQQTIPVSGKNIFIFGPNGYGKSSIIEAIRWCLFGLTGRPEEVVRNQFYTGDCFVELELIDQNGELWRVDRRLSPGATRSRMRILDPQGNERPQSEIFPFLTSLGPREGTYIVFGGPSQFPSSRRPLESIEISDFGKTIYTYLRLEDVPELIEKLNKLIEEQKEEEQQLAENIEEERRTVRDNLEDVEERLTSFLKKPPWEDAEPPTSTQTKEKIKELIKQLEQEINKEHSEDLSDEDLLDLAERSVQDLSVPKQGELNKRISVIKEQQNKVKKLQHELEEKSLAIKDIERQLEEIERKRVEFSEDKSLDDVRKELENLNRKIEQTSLLIDIIKKSQLYLENNEVKECFICWTEVDKEELRKNIDEQLQQVEPDKLQLIQRFAELKTLLEEITRLNGEFERIEKTRQQYQIEYEKTESVLSELLNLEKGELTSKRIESYLKNLETQIEELEKSLGSEQDYHRGWEGKIERSKEELRFHRCRNKKENLERRLEIGLKPVEERFGEFVEFRESLEEIRQVLYSELKKVLTDALPSISAMMTEVYKHLTNPISFDQIQIELGEENGGFSPRLLVRVASSDELDLPPLDPQQVLSGQALNALRLVPYFVFSRFQMDTWGLDLLLLDDPTQSFDGQRIELLLKELGTAAIHAQLIISTHEEDRFTPLLSKFFKEDQRAIVQVKGFDRKGGPQIGVG